VKLVQKFALSKTGVTAPFCLIKQSSESFLNLFCGYQRHRVLSGFPHAINRSSLRLFGVEIGQSKSIFLLRKRMEFDPVLQTAPKCR
jgi:hypothetical protein